MTNTIEDALTGIEERLAAISVFIADLRGHLRQLAPAVSLNDDHEPPPVRSDQRSSSVKAEKGSDISHEDLPSISSLFRNGTEYEIVASNSDDTTYWHDLQFGKAGITVRSVDDADPILTPIESDD